MKKFFSLLCATLLVFSASAAPVAKKAELVKKAPVAVEQMQKVQFEKVQTATLQSDGIQLEPMQTSNENQLSATPAVKVNNQKATVVKGNQQIAKARHGKVAKNELQVASASVMPRKAPAATNAQVLDIVATNFNATDYGTDMYFQLIDSDGWIYCFDVYYTGSFEYGKTYTYADMDQQYSCLVVGESGYAYDTASITLTIDGDGLTHVVAYASVPAADMAFNITYDQLPPQSKTIVASDFSMTDYGTDMFCILTDSVGNQFRFDVLYTGSFEFDKTYTLADMDPDYSWYKLATGGGVTYTEASITVTEDQDELLHVVANVVLSNGDSYSITYDEKAFVPTGVQINVNATNYKAEYISYYGEYSYTASNEDFYISIWVYTDTELGTFDEDVDIEGSYLQEAGGGDYVIFHSVATPIVVAQDEDGNKSLTGSLYAENGDEYVFNLTYEKPKTESISVLVEDATMTKKTLFFQVDGNDTENAYGITVRVNSKVLEGEFTLDNCEPYNTGVTDLTAKKWFDTDSCYIKTQMLGSNTLLMQGILYTHNTALDRYINAEFVLTARVDANGELMDIYGGIVTPAKGDTISLTRSEKGTAFFKGTYGLDFGNQSGKTTMVAVNDSAYYWYNPISKLTTGYWIKGIKDKAANTINFDTAQVINVYNSGTLLGLMKWMKVTTAGSISIATDGAEQFVLDINEDTLTLHGSAPFDFSQDVYFPGVVVPGYGFQYYGDAGTILTVNKPITERDTVDVISVQMDIENDLEDYGAAVFMAGSDAEAFEEFIVTSKNATTLTGTYSTANGTMWDALCYFVPVDGKKTYIVEGEFTVAENETGLTLKGWGIGEDEKYYRLDWYKQTVFDKRDTVKVNLNSIIIEEDLNSQTETHRGWLFEGEDTDTLYIVQVLGTEKYGTFSYAAGTLGQNFYNIIPSSGQGRCQFTEGEVTIVEDEEGVKLTGLLIGQDEKAYVFNWIQPAGKLQYDADAPFDATFAYSDMSADLDEGVIGIYATNAEGYTIGLELYADPAATEIPAGVYTISDTQEAGTALKSLGIADGYLTECFAGTRGTSGINVPCWFLVDGTITLSYDEYDKLKVVVDGTNSYGQPVTALIAYEKIEPKKTVDFTDAELYIYDGFVEQYGIMNFYGGNADGYEFDLYAYADTYAGDFLEAIDFGDCKLTSPAGSIGIIDAYEFKVEADGKNLTLTAKVLGSDTVQYNITATGYLGYIQGDAVEGYVGEFAVEEVAIQEVTLSKVKYIYIQGENAAGDQLALVVKGELEDGAIAAGTYTEVMACTGFDAQGQIAPSYVGNNTGVWFIQSGELVVNENGAMAFAGVNSYDAPVAIGFTVPVGPATDYYLVGWINNAAYGIEGDIDNFGDYHFVDGKVRATFDVESYVQVKDNNKQIYGTDSYIAPAEMGNATLVANGPEKIAINGGAEYEYTLVVNEDGTLTLSYEVVTVGLRNTKANVKAAKRIDNGQIIIVRENKKYNILGAAL